MGELAQGLSSGSRREGSRGGARLQKAGGSALRPAGDVHREKGQDRIRARWAQDVYRRADDMRPEMTDE